MANPDLPSKPELDRCRRCPLGERATQGVPGDGPAHTRMMLVGEQPGNDEDLAGKPFVGPAGKLLRRALKEAGIDAATVFVTNAVKHFSFELRGVRRIHKTPAQREIEACRIYLEREIASVAPKVIVALGATALGAVMGRRIAVGEARTRMLTDPNGVEVVATYHPSAVLRAIDEASRERLHRALVDDLVRARGLAA